jgi:hypothetical protein
LSFEGHVRHVATHAKIVILSGITARYIFGRYVTLPYM